MIANEKYIREDKIVIKQTKENLGITLIALIITIIVLLILAGVTISSLTKENGILNKADSAKFNSEIAKYKEELNVCRNK